MEFEISCSLFGPFSISKLITITQHTCAENYPGKKQKLILYLTLTTIDGTLWKATKQLLCIQNPPATLRDTNGNWANSNEGIANFFVNHLAYTFYPHCTILQLGKINEVDQFLDLPLNISPSKTFLPS